MRALFPTARSDPELAPFRPGLVFAFFNAIAWQIGIGTPMVLFAEELGATPFQVGLAYSFVFVLTPVQILSTALLPRYGFKAVMLGGWRTRAVFLAVPAVLAALALRGPRPWMADTLVWSVFLFCLFRSIGAASGISWFYAILPERVRGRYFGSDQFASAVASVGTLLACAGLFAVLPVYWALLIQYLIALTGAFVSYFSLRQLPDAPRPAPVSLREVLRDTPRHLFAPSVFRKYVWLAGAGAAIVTPLPPFAAYYLKVGPGLSTAQIMVFEVARYAGVMAAAWILRRRIDELGARPFFLLALGLYALVAGYWWVFLEWGAGGIPALLVSYFLLGLAAAVWVMANLQYLPKATGERDRTLAVSIHGAFTALLGGLAPILWGLVLKAEGGRGIDPAVFQLFFLTVVAGALVLSQLIARLPEDRGHPVEPLLIGNAILRPFRAMTYLASLVDHRAPPPRPEAAPPDGPPRG